MRGLALLVDDDELVRTYVSAVLREEGYSVLEAANGIDALSIVHRLEGNLDVLVTDIKMPHMTGVELVTAVKSDFPGMPVVFVSGEACGELDDRRARVRFLRKPFGPHEILEAVRTVAAPAATATPGC